MYKNLPKDYGIRKWVEYDEHIIEIYDCDPYHYGIVKDHNGKIVKKTEMFNPKNDERVIEDLKDWIKQI